MRTTIGMSGNLSEHSLPHMNHVYKLFENCSKMKRKSSWSTFELLKVQRIKAEVLRFRSTTTLSQFEGLNKSENNVNLFSYFGQAGGFKEGWLASALGSFRFTESTHRVVELVYFLAGSFKYNSWYRYK